VSAGSDDPLVIQVAVAQLRREKPFSLSHIVDGGGDAQQFKVHQQSANDWLIRIVTQPVELPTVIRKRELTEELEDLEHYLTLDERFAGPLFEIKSTRPGRQRNKVLELFWTRIYNGYYVGEMDALQVGALL
jgi:hypothetical protein